MYHRAFKKLLILPIVYSKCGHESGKIFKEEEPIEILIILGLINNIEDLDWKKQLKQKIIYLNK